MFGKTLRKIRKNKGLLQKEVCSGIVSLSYYSRIERDLFSPTIEIFLQLLTALNITFDEFLFIHNGNRKSKQDEIWDDIFQAFYKEDVERLRCILEELKVDKELCCDDSHYVALIENFLTRLGHASKDSMSIKNTINRLLEIQDWTYFELKLFISMMDVLPVELNYALVDHCLKSKCIYEGIAGSDSVTVKMLVNIVGVSVMEGRLKKADYYLAVLHKNISNRDMYTRNLHLFFAGIIDLLKGNKEIGQQKLKDCFEMFKKLGMEDSEKRYQNYLRNVLKKHAKDSSQSNKYDIEILAG